MKKILTILAVALLTTATVFASVNFSGNLVAGYQFQYDQDKWTGHIYGQDGDDTNTTKLNLKLADDAGIWNVAIEGVLVADGRVSGDVTLDLIKLFNAESDFSLKLGLLANDEQTGLRAYVNKTGKNYDRIRTGADGLWTSLQFGWADMLSVQVAGSPSTIGIEDGPKLPGSDQKVTGWGDNSGDLIVSALVTPIAGLKVSADYALDGENKAMSKAVNKGVVGGAVDVNVGKFADLDFDLGVSAAERYEFETKYNVVAATVYGGVKEFDAFVEYALCTEPGQATKHYLLAQANLKFIEGLPIDVYFGANNIADFANTFIVGGDIGYKINGVDFKLGVEYSKGGSYNYDNGGLVIAPSVGVSF